MKMQHEAVELDHIDPFTIAYATHTVTRNGLVKVTHEHDGRMLTGLGECPSHGYIGAPVERIVEALERLAALPDLLGDDPFALEAVEGRLLEAEPDCPPARAGVICAVLDIYGQILGRPLWQIWGLNPAQSLPTDLTIGIDTTDYMVEKALRAKALGYATLKIKLGTDRDTEIFRAIKEATGLVLRVDANCGWAPDEAVERCRELEELGVEMIEQPIEPGDPGAMRRVSESVGVDIIADESCLDSRDAAALAGVVDGVNIKLAKCGGPLEALRIIHVARAHGMKVMFGCNSESSIGITACAHLASLGDYIDLDGNLMVKEDPYRGVVSDGGRLILPDAPGLGVTPAAE